MINATHNFTENFLNAIGSNDEMMLDELAIDELARLIVENKRDLVEILRKNNVNSSIRDKDEKLAKMITKYIESDPKIRFDVVQLIKSRAIDINKVLSLLGDKTFGADASTTAPKKQPANAKKPSKFLQNIKSVISDKNVQDSVVNTLMGRFETTFDAKKTGGEKSNLEKNTNVLQERVKLAQMENPRGGMSKGTKIALISAGVITVMTVIMVIIVKLQGRGKSDSSDVSNASVNPTPNV
jgi:hypothetical protein